MSQTRARLKRRIGYEDSAPRCETCADFRPAGMHLIDSLPHWHHARCVKFRFQPRPQGCCDHWTGRDGARLDGAQELTALEIAHLIGGRALREAKRECN